MSLHLDWLRFGPSVSAKSDAQQLGNTRAVCRKCYIHPEVIEGWTKGTLEAEVAAARKSFRKPVDGLDEEETLVLRWLQGRVAA